VSGPPRQQPAIVVGHVDYAERDRIVRLLTPDLGRVSCLARGARGSRHRYGGALDTGNKIQAVLRPGRGDLWHLGETTLVEGRSGARADLVRLTLLAYACELCAGLAREHHPEPRLYGLLDMASLLLDTMTAPPRAAFRAGLESKALTFSGITPTLTTCAVCNQADSDSADSSSADSDPVGFDPTRGGRAHLRCQPGLRAVPIAWTLAVEAARQSPLRDLIDTDLPPGPPWALSDMIQAHLGRALNSRQILAPLEQAAANPLHPAG